MTSDLSAPLFDLPPPRNFEYYLETVVFLVQDFIYKVPRFQFERHSQIFATTFTLPPPADAEAEGSSEKNPFKLDGVNRLDFERLLKVLYPLTAVPKTPSLQKDEWISVLKLATMWQFVEIRQLAIDQLAEHANSLNCVERILLGRQYDVSAWLRSGYTDLARRETPISLEEATKIGWEVALQICHLREAAVQQDRNPYQSVELGDLFQAEFKRMDSAHDPLSTLCRTLKPLRSNSKRSTGSSGPGHFSAKRSRGSSSTSTSTPVCTPSNKPFGVAPTSAPTSASFFGVAAPTAVHTGVPSTSAPNLPPPPNIESAAPAAMSPRFLLLPQLQMFLHPQRP